MIAGRRIRRCLLAGLLVVLAGGARTAGIRFLEEFRFEDATSSYAQVSANRYFLVGYPMEKNGDVLAVRYYNIFDIATRRIDRTSMPLADFRARNAAIFRKTEMPSLVHYDGRYSTFTMDERPQIQAVARYLCRYDHQAGTFSVPIRLGGMSKSDWTALVQFDPLDRYVYYAVAGSATGGDVNRGGATAVRLARVRLDTWQSDWAVTIRPYRGNTTVGIAGLVFSQDGRQLAFTEGGKSSRRRRPPIATCWTSRPEPSGTIPCRSGCSAWRSRGMAKASWCPRGTAVRWPA